MIEPSGCREIARSATTSSPIPFVFALGLAFAALTLVMEVNPAASEGWLPE